MADAPRLEHTDRRIREARGVIAGADATFEPRSSIGGRKTESTRPA